MFPGQAKSTFLNMKNQEIPSTPSRQTTTTTTPKCHELLFFTLELKAQA